MAGLSKEEYLKRYLSGDKTEKKKKKKTTKPASFKKSQVIDDDIDLKSMLSVNLENTLEDELEDAAPTIAGFVDERPEHIQRLEEYRQDTRWKLMDKVTGSVPGAPDKDKNGRKQNQHDSDSDQSPQRFGRHDSDSDNSPKKKTRHDSDSDNSPERKTRHESDSDNSPKRKTRHDSDSDNSPERKTRHDSDSDESPKRNIRLDSDSDRSPKRKSKYKSDSDQSPKRKKRHDSGSDQSPPRRKKERLDSNGSPHRRKTQHSDFDQSPPRKKGHQSDSDQSPPRKKGRQSDSDQSPPRSKLEESGKNKKYRKSLVSDVSPSRRKSSNQIYSGSSKSSHGQKSTSPHTADHDDQGRMQKTLSGKKAGLSSAKDMRSESNLLRKKEDEAFRKIGDEKLGKNAATVFRDKSGKRRNLEDEKKAKDEEMAQKAKEDEKYQQWGKGLKQQEDRQQNLADHIHEISKPFARYKDDEDLDKMQREMDRSGDPMLAFIKKKRSKTDSMGTEKPRYKGPAPPPNRFGIMPGYRWDGVDRSNGFEKQIFAKHNERKATADMAYKWSVEDM